MYGENFMRKSWIVISIMCVLCLSFAFACSDTSLPVPDQPVDGDDVDGDIEEEIEIEMEEPVDGDEELPDGDEEEISEEEAELEEEIDPFVSVSGTVLERPLPSRATDVPVEAATVCLLTPTDIPCVQTDAEGVFTIEGVERHSDVSVGISKDSIMNMAVTAKVGVDDLDLYTIHVLPTAQITALLTDVGVTADDAKAHLVLGYYINDADRDGASDVSVSLTPASGDGPYYFDGMGAYDDTLTASGASGIIAYFNVDPGDVELMAAHDSMSCGLYHAWDGSELQKNKVGLYAGYLTSDQGLCVAK